MGKAYLENSSAVANASIVDQDTWVPVGSPNLLTHGYDCRCVRKIAMVEVHIRH
jgi:hypothetical protein